MINLQNYESVYNRCATVEISQANEDLLRDTPTAESLWPPFWNRGEICVLFSETNVGKSIIAVQMAKEITDGWSTLMQCGVKADKLLYFDYELSAKQFKSRYGSARFSPLFYRASPVSRNLEMLGLENAVGDIIRSMASGYKVIIVDNITFLSTAVKDATSMLELMKTLKSKASVYGCSLLLIAHTPKRRQNTPLTANDIAGSSNILNFADSAFAIGRSYLDPQLRYLKQIKVRDGGFTYNETNVLVGNFRQTDNFLQFVAITEQPEHLHLMN